MKMPEKKQRAKKRKLRKTVVPRKKIQEMILKMIPKTILKRAVLKKKMPKMRTAETKIPAKREETLRKTEKTLSLEKTPVILKIKTKKTMKTTKRKMPGRKTADNLAQRKTTILRLKKIQFLQVVLPVQETAKAQ